MIGVEPRPASGAASRLASGPRPFPQATNWRPNAKLRWPGQDRSGFCIRASAWSSSIRQETLTRGARPFWKPLGSKLPTSERHALQVGRKGALARSLVR